MTTAVLRVRDDVIVMQTMLWPDEVRKPDFAGLDATEHAATANELKMAKLLVETLAGDYDASEFDDDYAKAVEALVTAKLEGGEVKAVEQPKKTTGEVVDLLAALQRSVDAAKTSRGESPAEPSAEEPRPEGADEDDSRRRRPPPRRPPRRRPQPRRRPPRRPTTKKAAGQEGRLSRDPGHASERTGVEGRAGGGPGPGPLELRGDGEQRGLVVRPPDQLYGGRQTVGREAGGHRRGRVAGHVPQRGVGDHRHREERGPHGAHAVQDADLRGPVRDRRGEQHVAPLEDPVGLARDLLALPDRPLARPAG